MHQPLRTRSVHARPVRAALATLLVMALVTTAACESGPSPTDEPVAIGGRVASAGFILEVRLPSRTYAPTDAIPVTTTLTWTGAPGAGRIWGSGSGPVSFTFTEVGGAGRTMGGAMTADCAVKEYAPGVATAVPLAKSGGWTGEDPNAAFYGAWFRDPELHLPPGQWQMRVSLLGSLAPCDANGEGIEATVGPIDIIIR